MVPTIPDDEWIARAVGATIVSRHRLPDGERALLVEVPSYDARLELLGALTARDALLPGVRRLAEHAARNATDARSAAAACHAFVRDGVRFTGELLETFTGALELARLGAGDCDDSSRLLCAMLLSLDFDARLATLGRPARHVAAVVWLGRWLWAETTLKAELGEHPLAAARRLGVPYRKDLEP